MHSGWVIEHQCPQCGAPVTLEETDHILTCGFCRVRHLIIAPGAFEYYLTPRAERDDLLFMPYWRFRGLAFTCSGTDIRSKVADTSICAADLAFAPPSLGLRPQAMKLRFVSPDIKSYFIKKLTGLRELIMQVDSWSRRIDSLSARENVAFREFIGETSSIIYAPFYYKDKTFYDAVLDQAVHRLPPEETAPTLKVTRGSGWQIQFLPTLCPQCGWDLGGEKGSCVLVCQNCESAWVPGGRKLHPVSYGVAETDVRDAYYIPFWCMQARASGVVLQSVADLARFANLPKAIKPEWEQQQALFWTPAFKIRPKLFLRLTQQLTSMQPSLPTSARLRDLQLSPVTLPQAEAAESVKIALAQLAIDKRRVFPLLNDMRIEIENYRLVYLPFTSAVHELVQCHLGFSINKTAFQFGKKI